MNFEALGMQDGICKGLLAQGIDTPTPIQAQSIPMILANKNLLLQAETGSGKTLAYLLPLYARYAPDVRGIQTIILVPTRELAMQVHRQVELLSQNADMQLTSAVVIGDVNINSQIEKLKAKPQIVIGTSGRIIELIKRKKITAHTIKTLVIDEADKMLERNNMEGVKAIMKAVMRDTQIIMLSASVSDKTQKTAGEMVHALETVKISQTLRIPVHIQHLFIVAEERDKFETFRKLNFILQPKRAIVFINNADKIDMMTAKMQYHKIRGACIQGASAKERRKNVLSDFAAGKLQILMATDIAARGLHIEDIELVFNISMPEDSMDYLHRAGRTGRNSAEGTVISIVTKRELVLLQQYQKAFGIRIQEIKMRNGEILHAML